MEAGIGSAADVRIYRADVVGSMLRPAWLMKARQQLRVGALAPEAYKEIEDRAVAEGIAIQEHADVDAVTDGEMGREIFFDLFVSGMSGFSPAVLRLVSTRWRTLEEPALLRRGVHQAAAFHPRQRLALATQCGFASASETAEQLKITPEIQAAKLRQVADVAHSVWS